MSLMKFYPTWTCIIATWWSMAIDAIASFGKVGFDGTRLKM
jgi:hypothetical protein